LAGSVRYSAGLPVELERSEQRLVGDDDRWKADRRAEKLGDALALDLGGSPVRWRSDERNLASGGWNVFERRAHRDRGLALCARFELGDEPVEMRRNPGVKVGERDGLAFVWVNGEIDQARSGKLAGASCSCICAISTSLKFRHLTPYSCEPIQ
jgi:hypothetical protein